MGSMQGQTIGWDSRSCVPLNARAVASGRTADSCGAALGRAWVGVSSFRVTKRYAEQVRVRVTELKYVVLQPVYQIIREPGWSLRV